MQTGLERARRRNRTLFGVLCIVLALASGILAGRLPMARNGQERHRGEEQR